MAVLVILLLILSVFGGILWNYTRLNSIPGPLLAGLSDIWWECLKSSPRYADRLERLHQKYGVVVRIGPSTVSVSDPSTVFGLDATCPRRSKPFLESYVDEPEIGVNARLKSNNRLYPDEQTDHAFQHDKCKNLILGFFRAIRNQRTLKLAMFRTFATDIVGMFVDDLDNDRAGLMRTGSNHTDRRRFTTSLDHIMMKSPATKLKRKRNKSLTGVTCTGAYFGWSDESIFELLPETGRKSFPRAETRGDGDPHIPLIMNGVDCMIAAFVSVFVYSLKCPTVMSQLKQEIDIAFRNVALSDTLQQETGLYALPFLDAVMKESMRLAMRFDYQRDVPAGGVAVSGHYLPEGTVVQFHSEMLKNNRAVYGEDVSSFRPQRWLQADLDGRQRKRMEEGLLVLWLSMQSSAMARAAWLELKRAVALIIWKFDLHPINYGEVSDQEGASPEQENIWVDFTPRIH